MLSEPLKAIIRMNFSVSESHFVLQISLPSEIIRKLLSIYYLHMDLCFQKKNIWNLENWIPSYFSWDTLYVSTYIGPAEVCPNNLFVSLTEPHFTGSGFMDQFCSFGFTTCGLLDLLLGLLEGFGCTLLGLLGQVCCFRIELVLVYLGVNPKYGGGRGVENSVNNVVQP